MRLALLSCEGKMRSVSIRDRTRRPPRRKRMERQSGGRNAKSNPPKNATSCVESSDFLGALQVVNANQGKRMNRLRQTDAYANQELAYGFQWQA